MRAAAYKNYLLVVLLAIFALNYVDRLALGLVLQDIKLDLKLSDTQLGFLTGIAFALFYSVMGIPIARWADRGNRVTIISVTLGLWSVAVALCGMAASFLQLLLIRIGVAVGEAGCTPPAHSLIADYFTRAERPRAVARYMLGAPLSLVIGYFMAGWLNQFLGWRMTFVLLGLPGLVLTALAWLTLKEPRLERPEVRDLAEHPSLRAVCVLLWNSATFRHLLFCISIMHFFSYGIGQWKPAFFIRSYGLQTGELGTWFALIYGVGGMLGTYWGGEWASRRAAAEEGRQLAIMAIVYASFGVISTFIYLSPNYYLAFALMALAAIGAGVINGPLFATIQTLVPERMRAVSIAMIYLFANLIGMGLGPLAAGALSDAFRPWAGEESLRYALLVLCPGYCWAAWHLWQASRTVQRDLAVVLE
jgi:predicted MFS family arabinose efflux permease